MTTLVSVGELENVVETLRELQAEALDKLEHLQQVTGGRTVDYLRSFIDPAQYAPPIRKDGVPRKKRQGGWADRSGALAAAYRPEVERDGQGVSLVMSNAMEYAAFLEAKEGFFVVSGVTEPGGPVEMLLRKAVPEVAPDWEIQG